jgi:hypothetical protein
LISYALLRSKKKTASPEALAFRRVDPRPDPRSSPPPTIRTSHAALAQPCAVYRRLID